MNEKLPPGEAAERSLLIEQVMQAQKAILHGLQANAGPIWSQLDLTMSQMKALQVIAHNGPLPIGGLARVLGIGNPAASLLVDALVRQGVVTRTEDPDDRRRTLAALSPQGRELVERLQGSRQLMRQWLRRLSGQDLADLARALQSLLSVASSDLPACGHRALPLAEEPGPDAAR